MRLNSIIFKVMAPLVVLTVLVTGFTMVITQTYLKDVVSNIFVDLKVNNLKTIYKLKVENIISSIKSNGFAIASAQEVKTFLNTQSVSKKEMPDNIKQKLLELKNLYKLENIYIAHIQSKNYFNENGFVEVIDPSKEESSWFLKTLNEPKKYLINTDSDILGSVHVWNDVVVTDNDKAIGLAGCGVSIDDIFKIALDSFGNNSADIMILDNTNKIQASSKDEKLINKHLLESMVAKNKLNAITAAQKSGEKLITYTIDESDRYLLLIPNEALDWTVVIDFSKDEFLSSFNGIYDRIILGAGLLLILFIFIGTWIFTYLVTKPLKRLSDAVSSYDYKSDFACEDFSNVGYEIEMICNSFHESSKILRKAIERHKNDEELMKSIINAADDLIFYKDTQSRYLGCNKEYEKWRGLSTEEIIGKTDKDFYPADVANSHIFTDQEAIRKNKTIMFEEKLQKDKENFVILQVKKNPFYDKDGNTNGVVIITRDVTEIRLMEQDLVLLNSSLEEKVKEKTKELEASNRMLEDYISSLEILNERLEETGEKALQAAQARSNFISSMSHELRTPLNAIINFTDQVIEDFDEILTDKELQDDSKMYLNRVVENSKHLLKLINDLLDFTKIEAGKMSYTIEKSDISTILQMAYNNTYSLLNGSDVNFHIEIQDKPLIALVDSRRFLQILLNLISNAIKFTKKGSIWLSGFLEDSKIIVEIKDTGKGIAKDKHKIIFQPFMQANSTDNGTGLGLGLVKKMCDDMSIEITFTSEVGEGSTFRLSIPTAKS